MKIGKWNFNTDENTYVMGILNVTPDSFSDGGKYIRQDRALFRAEEMIRQGADIIDVGGESSRPGYVMIAEGEEIERIAPVIESVKSRFDIPISLDTCKSGVAKAGIEAGADLINDIWGLRFDPDMGSVIKNGHAACCLMHNRQEAEYTLFMQELKEDLKESVRQAVEEGIPQDMIMIDPGVGFGKNHGHDLEVLRHLEELQELGFPVLLGTSRKSVIGLTLDLPVEERVEGTIVTTVMAVWKACSFVRVHDVKENVRAIRMARAILME